MKKRLITFLIFLLFIFINICNAQWVQMSNGIGVWKSVRCFTISGNNIFAGTSGYGVYFSSDNGSNWSQTSLSDRDMSALTIHGNNIFAGTLGDGVYLSTNNGTNWSQTSLNDIFIYSIAVLGNYIFAGAHYGVYLSTNNGTNWTQTSLNNQDVHSLAILGNNIFAGTANLLPGSGNVYLSTNNGANWNQISLNYKNVYSLFVNNSNIFAGTDSGVFFSSNNGINWTQTALNNKSVYSLAILGNNIFAGSGINNGVYLSTNNGTSWIQKNQGFSIISIIPNIESLCILNNYIFAGTAGYCVWRRIYSEAIGIKKTSELVPKSFSLLQNYPNPFNPSTKIKFDIINPLSRGVGEARGVWTQMKVFDITGREITTLVNESLIPGSYEITFDGSNLPGGIYFYRLEANDFVLTNKMILLK